MDVILGIIWGIILDDPIYLWEIKTSLGNVCTQ
jgi:hypothetical protein